MNAVVTIQPSRMPIPAAVAREFEIQPAQWRVLVEQIFPNAKTVEAVMMALSYCKTRNLDIYKKPVHIVPMWSSALGAMVETVWPGIAEIRTTAARTGEYAGIDAVEFGPMVERTFKGRLKGKGGWEDAAKTVRFPEWASVVVYRIVKGARCAYHAKVFWEETYASVGKSEIPNDMWAKRSRGQLDKCVEAAAIRKAFPEEVGSMYAAEEMEGRVIDHDAGEKAAPQPPAPPKPPAPPANVIDAEVVDETTGEIVDEAEIVTETGEQTAEFVHGHAFDPNAFLDELEVSLAAESTVEGIEDRWSEYDPMAQLEGDDVHQGMALALKNRRLKTIGA